MANTSQASDLEGLHREMHGIAEQIRIMNENNARLIQHLSMNNPPPASTTQKIKDLDAQIDAINIGASVPITVEALIRQIEPPFTDKVIKAKVSSRFKLPSQLGVYEGKTDPMDHLDYKNLTSLQGYSDEVMCKGFSATIKGTARS
ncbi:hypothetical protein Acr_27g0003970 [Actinidia rufa]|uniref:Uncharacterized protein n=1 Tax=Actinidia rufa TaxID=165716 RepID=A0A7J0H6L4_9ERIC|nr:hypothetical protein Acr_27g0003970 [Actinidia rufa]